MIIKVSGTHVQYDTLVRPILTLKIAEGVTIAVQKLTVKKRMWVLLLVIKPIFPLHHPVNKQ